MKMNIKDKYWLILSIISVMVAFLIHFPEMVSLFDVSEQGNLFPNMTAMDVTSEIIFTFVSLLALFALNTFLFGFNRPQARISWQKMFLSFVLTWIVNNVLGKGFVFLHHQLDIPAIDALVHHYLHPLRDFIMSCVVSGSCYIIYLIRKSQQVEVENQQLHAENLLNQYEALKNQLNPHMLFNSLNTLRSLVREAPDRAQDYIQELSRVLRYTLQGNESQHVTLREELDFIRAYIFLMKMRYEDNLLFDISVTPESEIRRLPPMSLQLLIENAVKHNEISNRHPLTIYIKADKDRLSVSNTLQPKLTASAGTGIGLVNLAKRYNLLFKQDIEVRNENNTFTVEIPLI